MDRIGLLLKLLLLLALSRIPVSLAQTKNDSTTVPATSAGLQVNFGDVSFAGGMSYDSEHQIIYVTGQVGPNSCFVGIMKRVTAATTSSRYPTHLEFLSRQVFNEKSICQTIAYRKDVSRPGNALLLSVAEEGGLLTDQREEGSRRATQYGGLLSLEYSADGSSSEFHPDKSVLIYPSAVTIPRSIANDPTRTNRVFIVTMTSENKDILFQDALGGPHLTDGTTTKPNLTPGGGLLKYGKNFAMTVESIRLATEFSSAEPQWRKPFGVKRNSDNKSKKGVTVNQILFHQDGKQEDKAEVNPDHALFVVGSTLGSGPAFGEPEFDNDKGYGVVAGFITKLDPDSGRLTSSRRFIFDLDENGESNENSLRDTYVEAVCDAADGDDAIYIVGSYDRIDYVDRFRALETEESPFDPAEATEVPTLSETLEDDDYFDDDDGDDASRTREPSLQTTISTPFIAKLRASTLETIWQKDFVSTSNARAVGCGVDTESKAVYVAGNVESGGELFGQTTSLLGDDIFLLRLDTADGDVSWWKQLGTSSDDRLAYGGSGLVVLEGEQGVLLMGDTTGDLFSISDEDSEVFIVEVDADGNIPDSTENTSVDYSPDNFLVKLSIPTTANSGEQSDGGTGKEKKPDPGTPELSTSDTNSPMLKADRLYALVGVCIVAFAFLISYVHISQKRKRKATERALVFSYLQGFDLEDIDVKQAATGGWHGTYIGSLANGVNVLENNDAPSSSDGSWDCGNQDVENKLSQLSHSSVVRDILFMDSDDSVFSSVKSKDKNQVEEKDGIVRDPVDITEDGEDDRQVDPWGTEII